MADIAERYPEQSKEKYRAAVKDFRLPYFDYYRPRDRKITTMPGITLPNGRQTRFTYDYSMPQIFTVESVMVRRTSDDQLHSIENPLNRFSFPESGGFSEQDWNLVQGFSREHTVRYPKNVNDVKGDPETMNKILNREREPNNTIILDMIQDYDSFASFSSDSLTPGNSGSLEDIHGNYHGLIGGIRGRMGHMSRVPIAAFDPVFWMHHGLVSYFQTNMIFERLTQ
jgi:tyrosinase